jgi:mannosyl-3-phosphoglycerate synthase
VRIELPKNVERFGAIRFGSLQKVFELDSGPGDGDLSPPKHAIQRIPYKHLAEIFKRMAIVVPIRGERLKLVEGVLAGIPHPCLIIIVSNSSLEPIDRFHMEKDALRDFCTFVNKDALIIHQKDPVLAEAFRRTGYSEILGHDGYVRDGKAEGMIIAMLLAKMARKEFVGFVDADNYFPGAVEEYVREYAAGFVLSRSPYAMVRIAWHSKPKIVESKLFFRKWGRASTYTNSLLNNLISHYTGFETEILKTGNAGEHAMSMRLAMALDYSSGYSIEPYQIINLLERFGGVLEAPFPDIMSERIEVCQIESRNPHLHEAGDSEHVEQMQYVAMQVIYHSPICPKELKREILKECRSRGYVSKRARTLARPHRFPPLSAIDLDEFLKAIRSSATGKLILDGIGQATR